MNLLSWIKQSPKFGIVQADTLLMALAGVLLGAMAGAWTTPSTSGAAS